MKSKGSAYVLWCLSFFGILGFHRLYLRKYGTAVIWFFTGGVFGLGSLIDLFTLGMQVEQYNTKITVAATRYAGIQTASSNQY